MAKICSEIWVGCETTYFLEETFDVKLVESLQSRVNDQVLRNQLKYLFSSQLNLGYPPVCTQHIATIWVMGETRSITREAHVLKVFNRVKHLRLDKVFTIYKLDVTQDGTDSY